MTESIYVPFKLTTREACEKAAEVLLGEPSPMVKGDAELEYVEGVEAVRIFTSKMKQRQQELKGC